MERATSVKIMVSERQISGEMKIKETKPIIAENPASTENVTTAGKRSVGMLIVGRRRKINNTTSTISLWEPHYVEKSQKMTKKPQRMVERQRCVIAHNIQEERHEK